MMNSVITNVGATIALQSLNRTNEALGQTQKRVSTGFRVADSKDDGAAFAIAQRVRSDVTALTSVNEQLGGVKGLLDTTLSGLRNISDTMTKMREVMVKLGDDASVINEQREQYLAQYVTLADNVRDFIMDASYNGKSLLNDIGEYGTTGFVAQGTTGYTTATGTTLTDSNGWGSVSVVRNEFGSGFDIDAFSAAVFLNSLVVIGTGVTTGGLTGATLLNATNATTADFTAGVFRALLAADSQFTNQFNRISDMLVEYGNASRYLDNQVRFNKDKIDSLETGLGALIDADLAKESARLQSLQIRQQLGAQSLGIANQSPQILLNLFRG